LCQDEIIVEINSRHESNENSDIDNGDVEILQHDEDEEDEEEEEEANSEQKLLKSEIITVKAQVEVKSMHNGVGVNGFNEICLEMKMGW
jgi:hypothetical protein